MPLGGGALAPGTQVGLLVFGPFVQAAVAPPAAPIGLPGPPRLRSIGTVDASGMTATFRVVSNL